MGLQSDKEILNLQWEVGVWTISALEFFLFWAPCWTTANRSLQHRNVRVLQAADCPEDTQQLYFSVFSKALWSHFARSELSDSLLQSTPCCWAGFSGCAWGQGFLYGDTSQSPAQGFGHCCSHLIASLVWVGSWRHHHWATPVPGSCCSYSQIVPVSRKMLFFYLLPVQESGPAFLAELRLYRSSCAAPSPHLPVRAGERLPVLCRQQQVLLWISPYSWLKSEP